MTPREPDRFEEKGKALRQELERCGFVRVPAQLVRDCDELIAAALRQAADEALERAAQLAAGEIPGAGEAGRVSSFGSNIAHRIRALASPAAAPAAVPMMSGDGQCVGYVPPSAPVAPSLLPRVLAALEQGYGYDRLRALAAELRRYIAETDTNVPDDIDPRNFEKYDAEAQKRIAELETALRALTSVNRAVSEVEGLVAARSEGET